MSFQTYLMPNTSQPDVVSTCVNHPEQNLPCTTTGSVTMASRSRHTGGVQVLMGDGAVRFISDNIHLGTWRGLSTSQGSEVIGEF